jgi:hypothetical protein
MTHGSRTVPITILIILLVAVGVFVVGMVRDSNTIEYSAPQTGGTTLPTRPCTITAMADMTIYNRPDQKADIFGTIAAGETEEVTGKTINGWFAFDPHSAQAANVGVFRNRYISPTSSFTTQGDCATLPSLPALAADTCFAMFAEETNVYESANTSAKVVTTILPEGYARITEGQKLGFIKINTDQSSLPAGSIGYVPEETVNFNGRCNAFTII